MFKTLAALAVAMILFPGTEARASFSEFFGSSPQTTAIGNLPTWDHSDAGNNVLAPSVLAWSEGLGVNLSMYTLKHKLEDINSVVIRNDTNSTFGEEVGNVDTDYGELQSASVHVLLPLAAQAGGGKVGASVFTPVGDLIEIDTGDPASPEYVMYRARYRRLMIFLNYIHPWSESFAFSFGAFGGFQTRADMFTRAALSGTDQGSSAATRAKVAPSFAGVLSFAWKRERNLFTFTYQQEMKSELEANVTGTTSNPPIAFDIEASSMAYFDPHTFRFTWAGKVGDAAHELYAGAEYQLWENYQTPIVRIKERTGIESSKDFEKTKTKNIIVPKIGLKLNLTDRFKLSTGFSYRPTPLEGDFSGSGNSVDSDTYIYSVGTELIIRMLGKNISLLASAQMHHLKSIDVTKSDLQEDGSAGNKIGAPGYKVGGDVYVGTLGLKTSF